MVDPLPLTSSALPLPPLGSSQTALSASQACSMLMQCDHFQPSTSLCHVKGIYIQHYQCGMAVLAPVLSAHHPGSPAMGAEPQRGKGWALGHPTLLHIRGYGSNLSATFSVCEVAGWEAITATQPAIYQRN
ncbi:hypothetical protein PAMP_015083 [Pampus punctatissimus]